MGEIVWSPGRERIEATALRRFWRLAEEESGQSFSNFDALWRWSVEDRAAFWSLLWRFAPVVASKGWEQALENGDAMPGARWFTGARLNYAENLLRRRDDGEAIVCLGERGRRRTMTFAELHDTVAALSAWLQYRGIKRGDRVAGFLPNLPETIAAKLATASLGAVWSSCSPDFGTTGVLDRFGQIDPKVLITADGYSYGGRIFDSRTRVSEILDALPGIGSVVVVPWAATSPDLSGLRDAVTWGRGNGGGTRGRHRLRTGAVRSPARYHVFLGNHGRAQVHRPWPRWNPASAPQGAPAPLRPQRQRPPVLLLDLRLDDVELAGFRPGVGCHPADLRGQSRLARCQRAVGLLPGRTDDGLRGLGQVLYGNREGRSESRPHP